MPLFILGPDLSRPSAVTAGAISSWLSLPFAIPDRVIEQLSVHEHLRTAELLVLGEKAVKRWALVAECMGILVASCEFGNGGGVWRWCHSSLVLIRNVASSISYESLCL